MCLPADCCCPALRDPGHRHVRALVTDPIHLTIISRKGHPIHSNESCFHAVLPSDCYNSYRKSMRKSVLLGNKIPLVVRTPWQSCCWLSARHVTCPSVQPSPLSPLSHDGHNAMDRSVVDRWLQCGAVSRPPVTLNEYSCSPVTVLRRVPACSACRGNRSIKVWSVSFNHILWRASIQFPV